MEFEKALPTNERRPKINRNDDEVKTSLSTTNLGVSANRLLRHPC